MKCHEMLTFVRPVGLNTCTLLPQRSVQKNSTQKVWSVTTRPFKVRETCVKHAWNMRTLAQQHSCKMCKSVQCYRKRGTIVTSCFAKYWYSRNAVIFFYKKNQNKCGTSTLVHLRCIKCVYSRAAAFLHREKVQKWQFQKESLRCQTKCIFEQHSWHLKKRNVFLAIEILRHVYLGCWKR